MSEIVYVLTNSAMPGLIKIGLTSNDEANTRIAQLFTTGVPVPFTLEFACKVENAREVEQALHTAFAPHRISPKREFFEIDPEQAIAILRLLHTEDATPDIKKQTTSLDKESIAAAEQLSARRPKFNFDEMRIPTGSTLQFTPKDASVTVAGPNKVKLGEDEMSLTRATQNLLGNDYRVQPGPYWTFNGRSLRDIYDETYGQRE
jgi:hypothetical protein